MGRESVRIVRVGPNDFSSHHRHDGLSFQKPAVKWGITRFASRACPVEDPLFFRVQNRHISTSPATQGSAVQPEETGRPDRELLDNFWQRETLGMVELG